MHSATKHIFLGRKTYPVQTPNWRGILALAILTLGADAKAGVSDTIHPYVSVGYSYDDNLLRLPDGVTMPLGRSDSMTQLQAGVNLERPIGRQVLKADINVSRVNFSKYDLLNYNGKEVSGEWQWAILNDFSGHIGGDYSQTLTPFTDYHISERNLRTYRHTYADSKWRFLPSWEVLGGFNRYDYSYELSSQRYSNRVEDVAHVGINYLASSGSRFGLLARHRKGEYPYQLIRNGIAINNDYTRDEVKADIYWVLSGVTQVQLLAGWAQRHYIKSSVRDSSGANGRITGFWTPTGKLKFTMAGWREFSAVESSLVSSSLNRGASFGGTWQISSKLASDLQLRTEKRDFDKLANVALLGDSSDSSQRESVGMIYSPTMGGQIRLNTYRERRTGSLYVGTGSYVSKGVSLSLSGQF